MPAPPTTPPAPAATYALVSAMILSMLAWLSNRNGWLINRKVEYDKLLSGENSGLRKENDELRELVDDLRQKLLIMAMEKGPLTPVQEKLITYTIDELRAEVRKARDVEVIPGPEDVKGG